MRDTLGLVALALFCVTATTATACSRTSPVSAVAPDAAADAPSSPPAAISFGNLGSPSSATGMGSFRFGASTAATQIEDHNTNTDWYVFTEPTTMGGLGKGAAFVDNAVDGYTMALSDIALLQAMHVDSYRFSMEWARIEPQKGMIDESALQHYSDVLDALKAANIRPLVTIHHFSNPVWVDDPLDTACAKGPSATNLCGLDNATGAPMVIQAMADHAALLAQRFGDRVDEWGTVNEPINYLLAAYGVGEFPPGKVDVFNLLSQFVPVVRNYLLAHVAMYDAIKANDTVDADGDGVNATVGMTLSTVLWVASESNQVSTAPVDVAAQGRIEYIMNHLWVDSLENGTFDPTLSGTPTEQDPTWKGKLDWLGIQYYSRNGVTGVRGFFPVVDLTPCLSPLDLGSCIPPLDPTYCVPVMSYEYDPEGLYDILADAGARWPTLPLMVTEGGIATDTGARREENIVRSLEQIERAIQSGVDVRGYYHWSLLDNFEWALGFVPHFGLYQVDEQTYARTPTLGATLFGDIIQARQVTSAQRMEYGGDGPLTPEPNGGPNAAGLCAQ
jgi:beta-glucosidase/6-phospho-beta-glucosidase/beta-galactosidase